MFGSRLNYVRKQRGFTAQQMADVLSVSIRTYRNYESGSTSPSLDTLIKIGDFFGVSIDYLLGRTENPLVNSEKVL